MYFCSLLSVQFFSVALMGSSVGDGTVALSAWVILCVVVMCWLLSVIVGIVLVSKFISCTSTWWVMFGRLCCWYSTFLYASISLIHLIGCELGVLYKVVFIRVFGR